MLRTFGCCRFVFNHYLACRKDLYEQSGKTANYYVRANDLTVLKKQEETSWLREVDATALQSSLRDLDDAYQNFFRRVKHGEKPGFPRFKSKRDHRQSYKSKCVGTNIKVLDKAIQLPKLGAVKCRISKEVKGRILSVTVSRNPSGKYFVALCCTDTEVAVLPMTGSVIGIDMGIKAFAVSSDGIAYENHKYLAKSEKKLAKLQRQLSRKAKGECDVLIAIGMRFDDRVTGDLKTYAKQAKVIHLDIDNSEIGKNVPVDVKVLGNAKHTIPMITALLEERKRPEWNAEFEPDAQEEYEKVIEKELCPASGQLRMGEVVRKVSEATGNDAILVTDVGQNQMMGVRYFKYKRSRSVVTSGGLGTMGFGLPAAMGAKFGAPDRTVCFFTGDGGMQMTIQELGTIMQEKLDVKIIILNNNFLGMVRQWQELFFHERYSNTIMENPDFVAIAKAYGIASRAVEKREELDEAITEMLNHDGAYVLVANVETCGMVYPMVPAGGSVTNMILGDK